MLKSLQGEILELGNLCSYVSKGLSINKDITNIPEGNFDACDDGDKIKPLSG